MRLASIRYVEESHGNENWMREGRVTRKACGDLWCGGLSVKIRNLKRYWDMLKLYVRHGRKDAFHSDGASLLGPDADGSASQEQREAAQALADDLEKLGPTYVKFGQLLSTRPDLLPEPYLEALSRFQDHVKPFPFEEVDQILREELG